ncbi:MAG: carboxylating nicotinate-nucleotide diphosphorylase [Microcoleaceae cyanobacterium]
MKATLPPWIVLDPLLQQWLIEDIGRGDRTTSLILDSDQFGTAHWVAKQSGVIAGLPLAARIFYLLNAETQVQPMVADGTPCQSGDIIARLRGPLDSLLMGERVALNLMMRLSGVATLAQEYAETIADLPAQLVDTRKTTPGLRLLEKYASQVGGARNHRSGLDDTVMIKDNHIVAAGGIAAAVEKIRAGMPYPMKIEVETETLDQVQTALEQEVDIIMLDNMSCELMQKAVKTIRQHSSYVEIEASGNVTLETIRAVAETGVDYISTSAPITRSSWLDLSMRLGTGELPVKPLQISYTA